MVVVSAQRWRLVLVSSPMERLMMPSFNFRPDSVGMASGRDLFSMLGFGEGEGREIEKKEELQSMGLCFGGRRRLVAFIGFWKRFFVRLCFFFFFYGFHIYLVLEKFFFAFMLFFFSVGFRKVFLFVFMFFFFFKYCADVKNCESFRDFGFIYITKVLKPEPFNEP